MMDGVGETKGLLTCNYPKYNKYLHFECFQELVRRTEYTNKHLICIKNGRKIDFFCLWKTMLQTFVKALK